MELSGKTVLLTGATGGIGQAIAESLAARGASLILSSRKAEELERMASELPGEHRAARADLADEAAADGLVAEAGDIDGFVANAALPATGRLDQFSEDELVRALRVNLETPIRMTQALLPGMLERGDGHLVYISSLAGKAASPRSSLYSATKFGLRGFALSLREDIWGSGVGVSLVLPGFVREAGMFADSGAKPPPGLGTTTPREVANAVVRAIDKNAHEIEVAPRRQRLLANFAHRRPEMAGRFQRRAGGTKIAEDLAARQADKR